MKNGSILADKTIVRLNRLGEKYLSKHKFEQALTSFSVSAFLQYIYNQEYVSPLIEANLKALSEQTGQQYIHQKAENKVLFYDGFGYDIRGLAYIYLKALVDLDYQIIYIVPTADDEEQPIISGLLKKGKNKIFHLGNALNHVEKMNILRNIFKDECFSTAFFYSTPWDVSAVIAFEELNEKCTRYLINLTDHAFWIGINGFDYYLEFRNYGAGISKYFRGIDEDKLLLLPYYPMNNTNSTFKGFPFDVKSKKVVFSGGALYKTVDEKKTYYHLVEYIVNHHDDVIFLYAGNGYSKELECLKSKYPAQIYHVMERDDLLRVMENSYLYLNTYPISGSLMVQYAAIGGCVPVTLKRSWDGDASGILMNESVLGETFTDYVSVCNEIDHLLNDEEYWKCKKNLLKGQVISEDDFRNRLDNIIKKSSDYHFSINDNVNTKKFRQAYKDNISEKDVVDAVITKSSSCIWHNFMGLVVRKIWYKLKDLIEYK